VLRGRVVQFLGNLLTLVLLDAHQLLGELLCSVFQLFTLGNIKAYAEDSVGSDIRMRAQPFL
jgi:hypothetical protein